MRIEIIISALVALAFAIPHPQDQGLPIEKEDPASISAPFATPTDPAVLTTSLNVPTTTSIRPRRTTSSKRPPRSEPVPVFTKKCTCDVATVQYPCWATDALQKCVYEENFSYGCHVVAGGGCPAPTRVCSNLYQPTPRTGRHPCELGNRPPEVTSFADSTTSAVPAVPTLDVSFPSANVTAPVLLPVET